MTLIEQNRLRLTSEERRVQIQLSQQLLQEALGDRAPTKLELLSTVSDLRIYANSVDIPASVRCKALNFIIEIGTLVAKEHHGFELRADSKTMIRAGILLEPPIRDQIDELNIERTRRGSTPAENKWKVFQPHAGVLTQLQKQYGLSDSFISSIGILELVGIETYTMTVPTDPERGGGVPGVESDVRGVYLFSKNESGPHAYYLGERQETHEHRRRIGGKIDRLDERTEFKNGQEFYFEERTKELIPLPQPVRLDRLAINEQVGIIYGITALSLNPQVLNIA